MRFFMNNVEILTFEAVIERRTEIYLFQIL